MGKFKNILFQDVENPNESADGPITLRISALVMMIYLLIISVTLVMVHHVWWMAGNLLFVAIYGYLLYLTYENHTRTALILYNIVMLGAVCFNVMLIGWDSGLQHFLFQQPKARQKTPCLNLTWARSQDTAPHAPENNAPPEARPGQKRRRSFPQSQLP